MKILLNFLFILIFFQVKSQNQNDSIIKAYYRLAIQYKDGKGVERDDYKAFDYFNKASTLGDAQSTYAVAYMKFKGLGCLQDYDTAATLFAKGAILGRENSLYFYGLCWRNGYGRPKNEDSAKYYLKKSADLGYKQAMMELESKVGENSNDSAAQALLSKLHNAAIPNKIALNHFSKIQPRLPSSDIIAGEYHGWLIQYDWSGKYKVSIRKLDLSLKYNNKRITGKWIENDADTANINAEIVGDSVVFSKTSYNRTDHYSPVKEIKYNFQNAKLNLVQAGDSIFLAGDIEMFSPVRGEPSKPLFVALSRPGLKNLDSAFLKNLALSAYPNPFKNIFTIQFNMVKEAPVEIQLYDINGSLVYRNYAGTLEVGTYVIPVSGSNIAGGVYVMKLISGNHVASIKIIKQQ